MSFKCPLNKGMSTLGCLVNKIKQESCGPCPGVAGHLNHAEYVLGKVRAMLGGAGPGPGIFVPLEPTVVARLDWQEVSPEDIAGLVVRLLDGDLGRRVVVPDPCAKSRDDARSACQTPGPPDV